MIKADIYFKQLLKDIEDNGIWSKNPRTKWRDGTPAQYKSVYNKIYSYDISKGEYPITTLRTTPFRGCFEEMRWIYQLQSNIIEDAHESIHPWWKDFVVDRSYKYLNLSEEDIKNGVVGCDESYISIAIENGKNPIVGKQYIGATYGHIMKEYDLMNKLLHNLEHNPESRRNIINLWDNQSQIEDPKALPPCAYMTKWRIREDSVTSETVKYVDLSLYQRSRDTVMVYSINPTEYVFLQMMVANHLTYKTGTLHLAGTLTHYVEDEHVYDRNYWAVHEMLEKEPLSINPRIELVCEPKDFYDHRWEDFKVSGVGGIQKLSKRLEIAT